MEAEIYTLKGAAMAFDVSLHKLREAGLDIHHQREQQPSPPTRTQSPIRDSYIRNTVSITDNEKEESFAERETNRFEHKIDPIMNSGVKLIPCSQIWERLSQHPNFEDFDMDRLCEELKKKAKCSGTGPVIPESELLDVLRRMDVGIA
jgi:hypothetical protein